jgi:hypothetical protein
MTNKETSYAIMTMETDIMTIMADNLGGEQITALDLDRVSTPAGGGTSWTIPTLEGDTEVKELEGIIVYTSVQRVYWADAFTGGGAPPDCYSEDSVHGAGNPGGNCTKCPLSQFGSGENGKSQACQMRRLIFLIQPDNLLPLVVSVPPSSLKEAKNYLMRLASKGLTSYSMVSRLTLEKDKNADGIAYSKIKFASSGPAPSPDKIQAYVAGIRPHLERAASEGDGEF